MRSSTFADVVDPTAALAAPTDPGRDLAGDLMGVATSATSFDIGGTAWSLITTVLGFDPLDRISQEFAGHYPVLNRVSQSWADVAEALTGVRANLDSGRVRLPAHWTGDAATWFQDQMGGLLGAIDAQIRYADYQRTVAAHLHDFCQDLNDDMLTILDGIMGAAIEALATAWIPGLGEARLILAANQIAEGFGDIVQGLDLLKRQIDLITDEVHEVADLLSEPMAAVPRVNFAVRLTPVR